MSDPLKEDLQFYLRRDRDALLWKLDGLSEYDSRRPLTPTGTNVLGLVKHVASMACVYLGDAFGMPRPDVGWLRDDAEDDADLWARADETREQIVDFWTAAWQAADRTVAELDLDMRGTVPWWPPERRNPTLHRVLVHLLTELERHTGHADILRELVDGEVGLRRDHDNLTQRAGWTARFDRLEREARAAAENG